MKILIISGFLGAGKTTFIQELIRRTGERFAVLENEFGHTDVDEQVLTQDDNADIWGLTEGCVCCTKSADLVGSVIAIENVVSPEYLIVEPSGVGKLSNVIHNLQRIEYDRITLLKPITIIDGRAFAHDFYHFADIYQDQMSTAGHVLVSKPDHAGPEIYQAVGEKLEELNPDADLLYGHYRDQTAAWFRDLLRQTWSGKTVSIASEAEADLETYTIRDCHLDSPADLLILLEKALFGKYGEIVRAKGILPVGQEWLRFDIAGGQTSITGFDKARDTDENTAQIKSECVWIGRGIDRLALLAILNPDGLSKRF